ncbi:MAG: GatB/YqeY domain-containing protein [Patescibacteria group bacterium]|nr:GatB/YqeY domain-containing protein [Patescibacteria group bacterium]
MSLMEQVERDLVGALKKRDEVVLRTLRMAKTALQQAVIAKRPQTMTEAEEIKVLRTEIKRREEAIVEYQRGNRQDLVDKESAELQVLKGYVPAGPDDAAVRKAVAAAVEKIGAAGPKDFGKVMGAAMKELGANVDGAMVSKAVKEVLSKKTAEA